ncbi:winged helix-turn-helix transcriptional regulator [Levilactobacillus acidifarinae]|uniref:Transcriptional regulator n=1 Tax=Levilactobacillus acidifarinae DSM 19394 = JCM 15949 TaxID=1423715 RepID=A0A0R1LJ94_9LACO|nr:helix-turn-helix domain-containing protein [Levilactobacillus acidifarinae]KRK95845.1 transcriptional regulator [Levilactobacillus acidifarinae DSM 19394]GEO69143.1 MarR family transcriptional regulator [Levilactobacillus acidifarinae]
MAKKTYNIGVEATLDVISGKWKPQLLCHLSVRPQRTCDLRQELPEISQKVLTQQLRELMDDGIVQRQVYGDRAPFKVVYTLTTMGRSLGTVLVQMSIWGEHHVDELRESGVSDVRVQNDHAGFEHLLQAN